MDCSLKQEMIDDKYFKENMDEIVKYMVKNMPEKAMNAANWRRNMKKEGASNNISYVGFALAYQNDKKIKSYHKRIDAFYDKEESLDEREKLVVKRENTSEKKLRDVNQYLVDELKSYQDEKHFWTHMENNFDDQTLNYCGIYYRGD